MRSKRPTPSNAAAITDRAAAQTPQPGKTGKIPHKCDCLPGKIRLQGVELDHRMDREHQRRRFHPGGKPEMAASHAKSAADGLIAPWFQ
jgi:hypothetical protein